MTRIASVLLRYCFLGRDVKKVARVKECAKCNICSWFNISPTIDRYSDLLSGSTKFLADVIFWLVLI